MAAVIASIGAGRMGRGIAHAFAYAGHPVVLVDVKQRAAADLARLRDEAIAEVDRSLATMAALGAFDDAARPGIVQRIRVVGRDAAAEALAGADVVFEGVPEVIDAKRDAFAFAAPLVRESAIIASTTSTMLVTQLAGFVPHPARFINAHWLNPAYLIPLVELSPHPETSGEVVDQLKALLESIGKVPVVCAPAPGFIVPRLQSLIMNEAARMVEEGVATPEDIDRAVRYGFGFRYANMGVVEFIDYGGVDILHYASAYLSRTLGERYTAPPVIGRLMAEGRKGLREGAGFFDWSKVDADEYRHATLGRLVAMLRHQGLLRPPA